MNEEKTKNTEPTLAHEGISTSGSPDCSQEVGHSSDASDVPTTAGLFFAIRAAFRMLHELSVRTTGGGFTFHDFGQDRVDFNSEMSMPAKITFHAED